MYYGILFVVDLLWNESSDVDDRIECLVSTLKLVSYDETAEYGGVKYRFSDCEMAEC